MTDDSAPPARGTIAVVVHAYFEEDARVRRKVDALAAAGWRVEVFALRRPEDAPVDVDGPVRIHHLPVRRHQGAGLGVYLREYLSFLWRAAVGLIRLARRERVALVEVNTIPDFLAFAALPLRLRGVPLLLDLHEAMPEFFAMRFPRASNPIARWALRLQERASIAIASAVLTVNDALAARLRALGVRPSKVTVVMNSPSTQLFDARAYPRRRFRDDGRLRLVYTGALTPIYELDVVLRALATVLARRPELDPILRIYGRGDSEPALRELAASLGITGRVDLVGRIPLEDVPAAVAEADIGLAPTRRDAFTERSLSTKVFEYAAMGKPVVASRLPMLVATFAGGGIHLYASGDADDLARVIIELADDAPARDAAVAASRSRLAELGWDRQAARYLEVVDRLTARRR